MTLIGWKVRYEDGRVFSSRTSVWSELPADGAINVIKFQDELGSDGKPTRQILEGYSYYFRQVTTGGGEILGATEDTPAEIEARYPGAVVLRGKWTTEEIMYAAQAAAMADRDL